MRKISFVFVLAAAFSLSGCVSKLLRMDTDETPQAPTASSRSNKITLVVGGVGVASFATVGMLKKFYEENVEVEAVIATGWPALFALANGYLKSIHDLEWFATRLDKKDFEKMGAVDFRRDIDPSQELPSLVASSFPQTLLSQARVPVVLSATNTDLGEPDVFSSGEWKEPLLRTVSAPGMYRKFPTERGTGWIDGLQALDVREALRRGAPVIYVVSMYDDYLNAVVAKKDDELTRRVFSSHMRKNAQLAMKQGTFSSNVVLGKDPADMTAKRSAIVAGYREAAGLIKKLRGQANSTAN